MNLNNRVFVSEDFFTDVTFHYSQYENMVTATIKGINIVYGELVGLVQQDGMMQFIFNYLDTNSQFYSGECQLQTKNNNHKYILSGIWKIAGKDTEKEIVLLEI